MTSTLSPMNQDMKKDLEPHKYTCVKGLPVLPSVHVGVEELSVPRNSDLTLLRYNTQNNRRNTS